MRLPRLRRTKRKEVNCMSALDDAKERLATAQGALTDAAADLLEIPGGGQSVDYDSQVITNADGSVVITLTPTTAGATPSAPAAVSDVSGQEPVPVDQPAGSVSDVGTETELAGPGPTGQ
jgi:hypothetical protein